MLKRIPNGLNNLNTLSERNWIKHAEKYRVGDVKNFKLKDFSCSPEFELQPKDKIAAKEALENGIENLSELQEVLYAQDRWSLLVIFQAMDAAGKDGAIKHVMSGINPQGCQVTSFKVPSSEELDHDYLWRCKKHLPERGRIGIFNRSYYEEVLIVRIHDTILQSQKLPPKLLTPTIWKNRFQDIRNFEKYLNRNGTVVIKIFLHLSKEEQKNRFIERIDDENKNWKFSAGDIKERAHWEKYMEAYEEMIQKTSTKNSPWYVIPADDKPYARIAVASAIIHTLKQLELKYPVVNPEKITELQEIKKILLAEK